MRFTSRLNVADLGTGTPSSSNFLRGDGTWASVTPGAAGSDKQIQFNNGGVVAGSANLVWDYANSQLVTGGITPISTAYAGAFSGNGEFRAPSGASTLMLSRATYQTANSALGFIIFGNNPSGTAQNLALIICRATENHSITNGGTRIVISTTPNGTVSAVERVRIEQDGSVILNNSGAAFVPSATGGFVYVGCGPGRPTGTPTSVTGAIPLYYDTSNSLFWAYNGSWQPIGDRGTTSTTAVDYTQPAYESVTFVTATGRTITFPSSGLPAGTVRRVINTGAYNTTVSFKRGGADASSTQSVAGVWTGIYDGTNTWHVTWATT